MVFGRNGGLSTVWEGKAGGDKVEREARSVFSFRASVFVSRRFFRRLALGFSALFLSFAGRYIFIWLLLGFCPADMRLWVQ